MKNGKPFINDGTDKAALAIIGKHVSHPDELKGAGTNANPNPKFKPPGKAKQVDGVAKWPHFA